MTLTTASPTVVPAGWYPDPAGAATHRWWDGATWTEHTDGAPAGPTALGPNDSWIELGSPRTVWAWLLVFSPLIWGVVAGLIEGIVFSLVTITSDVMYTVGAVSFIAGLVPGWIFAALDRRLLRVRNYDNVPSLLWMLLIPPFAYLLRRRRAVRLEGEQTKAIDIATLIVGIYWGLQIAAGILLFSLGLMAFLATTPTALLSVDAPDQSGYGIGVTSPQAEVAGPLAPDDGSPLWQRVETVLGPAVGISGLQDGMLNCSMSDPIIAIPSSFPCNAALFPPDGSVSNFKVDVTIDETGMVSYTQQPPEVAGP